MSGDARVQPKGAEGLVLTVQPLSNGADPRVFPRSHAGWLDIVAAGAGGHDVELVIGKGDLTPIKRGDPVVILCAGIIRCRIACEPSHGIYGRSVVLTGLEIAKAQRFTVDRDVLQVRWTQRFEKHAPNPLTFQGARPAWWNDVDERPLVDWAGAGLPPDIAEVARGFEVLLPAPPRAVLLSAEPASESATGQKSLF